MKRDAFTTDGIVARDRGRGSGHRFVVFHWVTETIEHTDVAGTTTRNYWEGFRPVTRSDNEGKAERKFYAIRHDGPRTLLVDTFCGTVLADSKDIA